MRRLFILLAALLAAAGPALAQTRPTLEAARARGSVICAVTNGLPGFSQADPAGIMRGFDADLCRAIAAVALGDAARVTFRGTTVAQALTGLRERQVDVAARVLTMTMSRDVVGGLMTTFVTTYDGQGFLVRRGGGIGALPDLAGRRICTPRASANADALRDLLRREGLDATLVEVANLAEMRTAYAGGACDLVSADTTGLIALRSSLAEPAAHELLPDIISREPLGPLVREGDPHWRMLVFWTANALAEAEVQGITAANAEALRREGAPRQRMLLGGTPGIGAPLGLDDGWVLRAIAAVGNYGEMFERNLGRDSPLRLERGLNELYFRGGLIYPIPMR